MVIGTGRVPDWRINWVMIGPGPRRPEAAPSTSTPISSFCVDPFQDLFDHVAFADHQPRVDPVLVAHPLGEDLEMGVDPLFRLFAHQRADPDPVVEFVGRDHREDLDVAAGVRGAHRGESHRVEAFFAVVEHDEKFAHRVSLPVRHVGHGRWSGERVARDHGSHMFAAVTTIFECDVSPRSDPLSAEPASAPARLRMRPVPVERAQPFGHRSDAGRWVPSNSVTGVTLCMLPREEHLVGRAEIVEAQHRLVHLDPVGGAG